MRFKRIYRVGIAHFVKKSASINTFVRINMPHLLVNSYGVFNIEWLSFCSSENKLQWEFFYPFSLWRHITGDLTFMQYTDINNKKIVFIGFQKCTLNCSYKYFFNSPWTISALQSCNNSHPHQMHFSFPVTTYICISCYAPRSTDIKRPVVLAKIKFNLILNVEGATATGAHESKSFSATQFA